MNNRQALFLRKSWWLLPLLLLLLIAGGVIVYRVNHKPEPPQIQPVASYELSPIYNGIPLYFSAQGMGYPAIYAEPGDAGNKFRTRYRVIDDLCRPGDMIFPHSRINISPTRKLISWVGQSNSGYQFIFRRRDGSLARIPCPTVGILSPGPWPTSDGTFGYIYYDKNPRGWLYAPDGSSISPPPLAGGRIIPNGIASWDERLVPITDRKQLFIYDIAAKKIVLAAPFPKGQTAMIRRHEKRLLLAPHTGDALVFNGKKKIVSIPPGKDGWRWGEDGSVWTLSGGRLRVLRWHAGRPALVNIRTRGKPGTRYGSLPSASFRYNTEPDWAAVWEDGKLVASVENISQTGNERRLTLYRDHRPLGSYRLPTTPDPATIPAAPPVPRRGHGGGISMTLETGNHEHLAFTADGKYLSWAIDDGTGVRLFVFKVPSG